jgi:hypothetical protein
MKKMYKEFLMLLLLSVLIAFPVFTQKKKDKEPVIEVPVMKRDESTKMVVYSEVVEATGNASELYGRALGWMNSFYKNPAEVIKEKKENEAILGKARFNLKGKDEKTGVQTNEGLIQYDISFSFKDGRFKYEIIRINWKQPSYFGIEKWIDENEKAYNARYAAYLVQIDETLQNVISEMKQSVTTAKSKAKDDW